MAERQVTVFYEKKNVPLTKIPASRTAIHSKGQWIVFADLNDCYEQESYVNCCRTKRGGKHVEFIVDKIAECISTKANKEKKGIPIDKEDVKSRLWVFVSVIVAEPTFASSKNDYLTTDISCDPTYDFKLTDYRIKEIWRKFQDALDSKRKVTKEQELKKSDCLEKKEILEIARLQDATYAGGKISEKCTLILVEGDSAMSFAVAGLSVLGKKYYGVFSLKGRLPNVREVKDSVILNCSDFHDLKKVLGLQQGKDYETVKPLRYGQLMIITDQDCDGFYSKGLVINLLHYYWPSLLKIPNFIVELIIPTEKMFGTYDEDEKIGHFKNINDFRRYLDWDKNDGGKRIELAFDTSKGVERKTWLKNYVHRTSPDQIERRSFTDFIDDDLIKYYLATLERCIPCTIDGLKLAQRKILHSMFHFWSNNFKEIRVDQFAAHVAYFSAYYHGDQSLYGPIINMAQNFVGSNNVNFLIPKGNFGSRFLLGKEAAIPRSLFIGLSSFTQFLFKSDNDQLEYLEEDGKTIQPKHYLPIIPIVLLNGCEGVGKICSTTIYSYNPVDIINNLRNLMLGRKVSPMLPWYRGFKGRIKKKEGKSFTYGLIENISETRLTVTELPLFKSIFHYTQSLEMLKRKKIIKSFKLKGDNNTVNIDVTMLEKIKVKNREDLLGKLMLIGSFTTSNMNLLGPDGQIKSFDTPEAILQDFYNLRLAFYEKEMESNEGTAKDMWRKDLDTLESELKICCPEAFEHSEDDDSNQDSESCESLMEVDGSNQDSESNVARESLSNQVESEEQYADENSEFSERAKDALEGRSWSENRNDQQSSEEASFEQNLEENNDDGLGNTIPEEVIHLGKRADHQKNVVRNETEETLQAEAAGVTLNTKSHVDFFYPSTFKRKKQTAAQDIVAGNIKGVSPRRNPRRECKAKKSR